MRSRILILVTLAVCLLATAAFAQSLRERMAERAPAIVALKDQGVVGENNRGFLEFRAAKTQADMVAAENQDRATVYKAIAQKTGTSAELVGQRRAGKLAQMAHPGNWLQSPDGHWYKK
ncbi:MAG: YdbL family protein [Desulfovibrionaceae bacterium]|nr:YdbL family protein [Desulfovibrionaceae bacterium]